MSKYVKIKKIINRDLLKHQYVSISLYGDYTRYKMDETNGDDSVKKFEINCEKFVDENSLSPMKLEHMDENHCKIIQEYFTISCNKKDQTATINKRIGTFIFDLDTFMPDRFILKEVLDNGMERINFHFSLIDYVSCLNLIKSEYIERAPFVDRILNNLYCYIQSNDMKTLKNTLKIFQNKNPLMDLNKKYLFTTFYHWRKLIDSEDYIESFLATDYLRYTTELLMSNEDYFKMHMKHLFNHLYSNKDNYYYYYSGRNLGEENNLSKYEPVNFDDYIDIIIEKSNNLAKIDNLSIVDLVAKHISFMDLESFKMLVDIMIAFNTSIEFDFIKNLSDKPLVNDVELFNEMEMFLSSYGASKASLKGFEAYWQKRKNGSTEPFNLREFFKNDLKEALTNEKPLNMQERVEHAMDLLDTDAFLALSLIGDGRKLTKTELEVIKKAKK